MKKVFLAVLIVLFASSLYAGDNVDPLKVSPLANRDKIYPKFGAPLVQFDISGEFDARGYYWDNRALLTDDTFSSAYMRGYLDLWPKLKIGDTEVITKIQMRDQNPWAPFYASNGSELMDVSYDKPTPQANDNISVERAYIHHNFNDKWFTEVGLMNGQIWGTTFGDYLMPRWRVKFQGMTEYGAVGALYEKIAETGTFTVKDSEKDDYNAYALYGLTKLGDVTIEPLLYYHVDSAFYRSLSNGALVYSAQDKGSDGFKILYISLASRGKVGPLGMEAEFSYTKRDGEGITYTLQTGATTPPVTGSFDNDWVELGAYLNLWNDMDFGRVGAKMAYGSWDEDGGLFNPITQSYSGAGQDFREDFKSNLILGDEIGFGTSTAEDLMGMTLIQPYIKGVKLGSDKLTCSASFGYIMSNQKDTAFEDASAWEGDLGVQYMLSPNLLYKVDAGYASIDYDEGDDPDPVMLLKHEIILTF